MEYLKISILFLSSLLCFCMYTFPQVQCVPYLANIVKKNGVVTLKTNNNAGAASQFKSKTNTGSAEDYDILPEGENELEPVPDMPVVDLNNDPEISINVEKEETDSPKFRKHPSSTYPWRLPWSKIPAMQFDMSMVQAYTFRLNRNAARINFIGSRELGYTAVIACTTIILRKHGDFLQITDGLGGELLYTASRNYSGSRKPSNHGTDLYLRYKGKNPSTRCTVRRISNVEQISHLPISGSDLPVVDQHCKCVGQMRRTLTEKIVGGQDAKPFEFPWQASVVYIGTRIGNCGASLINERYAISAAHCFYKAGRNTEILLHAHILDQFVREEPELHNYPVAVPGNDLEKKTDADEQSLRLTIEDVILHPLYDRETFDYDVALIRFSDKIDFSKHPDIKPICLESWKARTDYTGQSAVVSGWGRPHENSTELARLLQKLTIKMYSRESCEEYNKDILPSVSPRMVCGGDLKGGKDACQGDSGGPLSINNGSNWRLIGVVSSGEGCARQNLLGLYTSIGETRQWIERTVERDTKWCTAE